MFKVDSFYTAVLASTDAVNTVMAKVVPSAVEDMRLSATVVACTTLDGISLEDVAAIKDWIVKLIADPLTGNPGVLSMAAKYKTEYNKRGKSASAVLLYEDETGKFTVMPTFVDANTATFTVRRLS